MDDNRSLRGCLIHIKSMIIVFTILFIGLGISKCSFNAKEELAYSTDLEDGYPAYINVISIDPIYTISQNYGNTVTNVVCLCTTNTNQQVWLFISTWEYEQYIDPDADFGRYGSGAEIVRFSEGLLIHGKVRDAEELCTGLSKKTGTTVLLFLELDESALG